MVATKPLLRLLLPSPPAYGRVRAAASFTLPDIGDPIFPLAREVKPGESVQTFSLPEETLPEVISP